jgi:hypothetical protein
MRSGNVNGQCAHWLSLSLGSRLQSSLGIRSSHDVIPGQIYVILVVLLGYISVRQAPSQPTLSCLPALLARANAKSIPVMNRDNLFRDRLGNLFCEDPFGLACEYACDLVMR